MSAQSVALLHELMGPPGADEDCVTLQSRVPDLAVWAPRDANGIRGCLDRVSAASRSTFVDGVLAAPDGDFVEDDRTRELGVFCARSRGESVATMVCLDRGHLDGMRREVGLGPLLADPEGFSDLLAMSAGFRNRAWADAWFDRDVEGLRQKRRGSGSAGRLFGAENRDTVMNTC